MKSVASLLIPGCLPDYEHLLITTVMEEKALSKQGNPAHSRGCYFHLKTQVRKQTIHTLKFDIQILSFLNICISC